MGVMFPWLAGCRLMFTAIIMEGITVVKHAVCVRGKAILAQWRDTASYAAALPAQCYCCICRDCEKSQTILDIQFHT